MRLSLLSIPVLILSLAGCAQEKLIDAGPVKLTGEPLEASFDAEKRLRTTVDPRILVLAGMPDDPIPVPDFEQTKVLLAEDENYRPLAEALTTAGYSAEEAAAVVASAALYGTGQPGDPQEVHAAEWRSVVQEAEARFEKELSEAEAREHVVIDRAELGGRLFPEHEEEGQ